MYVSAYLDAARVLSGDKGAACRAFALKTLDRMLTEAWSDARGFAHRLGGARLDGSLDDQIFAGIALLDAYEATLDPKYFDAARRTTDFAIAEYFDEQGGGFFDRTLASLAAKPLVIGLGYADASIHTIFPQPHDIPMDWIITGSQPPVRRGP